MIFELNYKVPAVTPQSARENPQRITFEVIFFGLQSVM
jgi:hypothetical protein